MAGTVKRRLMAAKLAIAFAAAGAIAGTAGWAANNSPPPSIAQDSALSANLKLKLDSSDIKNGSLLYKDFKAGEVLADDVFFKYKRSIARYKRNVAADQAAVDARIGEIKGELGTFVKSSDADARYLKRSDPVISGSGSVLSDSRLVTAVGAHVPLLTVPGLFAVEAENGKPLLFYVVNQTSGALTHTTCGEGGFGNAAGVVQPGKAFSCLLGGEPRTVQMFTEGANPTVVTLTVSAFPTGVANDAQYTTQVLIGQ